MEPKTEGHAHTAQHHPAAEIVSIALKKIISKSDPKRHQDIIDECNQFLAGIHQIIPARPPAPGQQQQEQQHATPGAAPGGEQSAQSQGNVGEAGHAAHEPRPAASNVGEQAEHGAQQQQEQQQQGSSPSQEQQQTTHAKGKEEGALHAQAQAPSDPTQAPRAGDQRQAEGAKPATQASAIPAAYSLAPRTPAALPDTVCSRVLAIMQRAGDTGKAPVIEVVLDCLQKLIAFSFLQGAVYALDVTAQDAQDAAGDTASTAELGIDTPQSQAISMMCRCEGIADDGVELQVLKGLLTATTSSTFTVHGQALLTAVRTCYNIFLTSHNETNQTTAKASLTQMLNVVFQRMEADDVLVEVRPIMVTDVLGLPLLGSPYLDSSAHSTSVATSVQSFLNSVVMVATHGTGQSPEEIRSSVAGAFKANDGALPRPRQSAPGTPQAAKTAPLPTTPDKPQQQPQPQQQQDGYGSAPAAAPAPAQAPSTPFLQPQQQAAAGGSGGDGKTEVGPAPNAAGEATGQGEGEVPTRTVVLQQDAFLVFRSLCKLSTRTSDTAAVQDITAQRGKILALELLKLLLENSGPVFHNSELFTTAIRQHLCAALLRNSTSAVPAALQLSCSIFLTLLAKFRNSLKAEVGVFFPMILLKPFEPPNVPGVGPGVVPGAPPPPPGAQYPAPCPPGLLLFRVAAVRVFCEACRDGQMLVDLFVNYDCDLESSSLFERMVNALVRLAQTPVAPPSTSTLIADTSHSHQEALLRLEALQALVHLVESLLRWYRQTNGMLEQETPPSPGHTRPAAQHSHTPEGTGPSTPAQSRHVRESSTAHEIDAGDGHDLGAKRAYKARFQEGVALFNAKPKKGLEFLQDEGMVGRSVNDVAMFLLKTKDLDKTTIGSYLGEREDFNIKVMHAFIDSLDFRGMEFDMAIRTFLAGFRLPGEAQKIDRLMEKFAERYLKCNPTSFKSADVAYVLAYSVIMLNTDLHNPQVKKKMTKEAFLKNNRGINDGHDLPADYMSALYDRIAVHEIKMKDESSLLTVDPNAGSQGKNIFTTLFSLMGALKQEAHTEPSDEIIKDTLEFLQEKAKSAHAVTVKEPAAVRPMMEVVWAPLLGGLSVLFDEFNDSRVLRMCLQGFAASCCITAQVGMTNLRDIFINSLCSLTHLHNPAQIRYKHALAFKYLLEVAQSIGDHLEDRWVDILRCLSRWDLLLHVTGHVPPDAGQFSAQERSLQRAREDARNHDVEVDDPHDSVTSSSAMHNRAAELRHMEALVAVENSAKKLQLGVAAGSLAPFTKKPGEENSVANVPHDALAVCDAAVLNGVFLKSNRLDSEAIVVLVRALCAISTDELKDAKAPRVFTLTKVVEVALYNMTRIRLVWSRIWAVLSDFFVTVGCHPNLAVSMYSVECLRQLAIKFLERDELANYTFQNDFLRPFVVVMRQSHAVEIRELIIRCLSQMVLARVNNVKSGWKSMFMVFTTAASDKEPTIVRLAFDTIEKIVREHFNHITETETATFTDCVNCLIAFTNNPHSIGVALNSIAFLRYCAMKLAEGSIGDVNGALPDGVEPEIHLPVRLSLIEDFNASTSFAKQDKKQGQHAQNHGREEDPSVSAEASAAAAEANKNIAAAAERGETLHPNGTSSNGADRPDAEGPKNRLRFVDRNEHVYFWFPLLAGLSELTFDPRTEVRNSSLEVLFDTLKRHGNSFAQSFWKRVFDSVLFPIFDHVRAEVTDTTTFTSEAKRQQEDAWLYETCTLCLQYLVEVFVLYYEETWILLPQMLQLLHSFVTRTHQSLACIGVAALVRLINMASPKMKEPAWQEVTAFLIQVAREVSPCATEIINPQRQQQQQQQQSDSREDSGSTTSISGSGTATANGSSGEGGGQGGKEGFVPGLRLSSVPRGFNLREGAGARRLAKFRCQAAVQLLLVQGCTEVYSKQYSYLPFAALSNILEVLETVASHAHATDTNMSLRQQLALQQAEDKVPQDCMAADPPLLRLEAEASHAYLSVLMHVLSYPKDTANIKGRCKATLRMVRLCTSTLARFAQVGGAVQPDPEFVAQSSTPPPPPPMPPPAPKGGGAASLLPAWMTGGSSAQQQQQQQWQQQQQQWQQWQQAAQQQQGATSLAAQGRTPDNRNIVVGRTSFGVPVLMASPPVEYAPLAPLVASALRALSAFDESTFSKHLPEFFPLMTAIMRTDHVPLEVLRILADLFAKRVGPAMGVSPAAAASGVGSESLVQ